MRTVLKLVTAALVGAAIGLLRRRPAGGNDLVRGHADPVRDPSSTA